ncbi:MAG: hypothetical protein FJ388_26305 [Verrucomicrobia bacterium]|nr:hypothetical protein [Verrucomicrobiota bacterium]
MTESQQTVVLAGSGLAIAGTLLGMAHNIVGIRTLRAQADERLRKKQNDGPAPVIIHLPTLRELELYGGSCDVWRKAKAEAEAEERRRLTERAEHEQHRSYALFPFSIFGFEALLCLPMILQDVADAAARWFDIGTRARFPVAEGTSISDVDLRQLERYRRGFNSMMAALGVLLLAGMALLSWRAAHSAPPN